MQPTLPAPGSPAAGLLPRPADPPGEGRRTRHLTWWCSPPRPGGSALRQILGALPADFPAALVVVQHRSMRQPSRMLPLLAKRTPLPIRPVVEGELLRAGIVCVAPPDLHAIVQPDRTLALSDGRKIKFVLSSANPLFESAAAALGRRVIAVVLTGGGSDATDGVQAVKAAGGTVIAQDEATSEFFAMPGRRGRSRSRGGRRRAPLAPGARVPGHHRATRAARRVRPGVRRPPAGAPPAGARAADHRPVRAERRPCTNQGLDTASALFGVPLAVHSLLVMVSPVVSPPLGKEALERAARAELDWFLHACGHRWLDVQPVVRSGCPAEEIVAEAEGWRADLVVLGTRGHVLLGSVAEAALRDAPCNVLGIPPCAGVLAPAGETHEAATGVPDDVGAAAPVGV